MTASTLPGEAALTREATIALLKRACRMPSLHEKYAGYLSGTGWIDDLPRLTKAELTRALTELEPDSAERHGGYLCASGGTIAAPTLSLVPPDMFVSEIVEHWQPLTRDDVLVNLFPPGRMWHAHHLASSVAIAAGASVLPVTGELSEQNMDRWLGYFLAHRASALAAAPSTLDQLRRHCASTGRALSCLRKLLWAGDELDVVAAALTLRHLPDTQVWGLYGSAETSAIGWNGPACEPDIVHPLPYQHVEVADGAILVTNSHDRCLSPLLRYETGGAGVFAECSCGHRYPGVRIVGRTDSCFKFFGQLISADEIVGLALEVGDVAAAQVVLRVPAADAEQLEIRVLPGPAPGPWLRDRVRRHVLAGHLALSQMPCDSPESVQVAVITALTGKTRTTRPPVLIIEPPQAGTLRRTPWAR